MASCPNINSEEWKDLVSKVGELEAYFAFSKNGYKIPNVDEDGNYHLDDGTMVEDVKMNDLEDKDATFFKEMTEVRSKILNALRTKYNIYEGSKNEKYIENLKKLINEFEQADINRGMFLYMDNINKTVVSLIKKMEKEGKSPGILKQLNDYSGSFDMIKEVSKIIQSREDIKQIYKDKVATTLGNVEAFKDKYIGYSRDVMAEVLAKESSLARAKYKEKFAREFRENNPKNKSSMSNDEYKMATKKYVKKMLNQNSAKILQEEKRIIRDMLSVSENDITSFTQLMIDPKGVNEHLIQVAVQMLDRAERQANQDFIEARAEAVQVWEDFVKDKRNLLTPTGQKKLYDGIIEKIDGKETNYYVREYYSTYYDAKNKFNREYFSLETPSERRQLKEQFEKDYPKEKFKNPQYNQLKANPEKLKMYNYLLKFNRESDSMVPSGARLDYRLPSITETLGETLTTKGVKSAAKKAFRDNLQLQKDDSQYGEIDEIDGTIKVVTDEKGKALKRVMVPFRNDIEPEDQSYDLMGMALTNRYSSLNYREKNDIKVNLEVLSDLMRERNVTENRMGKKMISKVKDLAGVELDEEQEIYKKGIESNSYKLMQSILEDRLYGRKNIKSNFKILKMDVDKMADSLIKMSSNNMLIANWLGAGSNVLAGKIMNFMEGTRKQFYSRKDLRAGENKYRKDMQGWLKDVGSVGKPSSKTNMLIEKFIDTSMDFSGLSNRLTTDNKFKELMSMQTLHGLNNMAEHYIQGTVVYAMLNNTKVVDKDGNYIDKNGNITADRNKAIGMDEAYEIKDGKLVWKNDSWDVEDNVNPDKEFDVSRKLKEVIKDLHGNYDENNRAQAQRYAMGKLGFFLRKWMLPGIQRRWRGIDYALKDGDIEDLAMYSEATKEFKEGTYVSAIRFMNTMRSELKFLKAQVYTQEWNKLSDTEKGNIRNVIAEVSMMILSVAAGSLLAELGDEAGDAGDEDKEQRLYSIAYVIRRQYGELSFYLPYNVAEMSRVLRTPSATVSTVELAYKTVGQLLSDVDGIEYYQSGKNKGESKSYVLINKLFNPFYKQFVSKDAKESYEYLTNIRQ